MTQDKPLITTIITTYRRPQLLKRAVNSVLKQTYPNFEVCVYDNASGDETAEIMKELCSRDSRIRYHCHAENIGMMANYEYGLSQVNTPFFSILSDDDYLVPCFYETGLQAFKKHPEAAFVACGVLAVNGKGEVVGEPLSTWPREGFFPASEGSMEMIRDKSKLPIPTSILFQHQLVKETSPDFSQEMQLMWDPDYLLQIAARFPIVICKKICGIFTAHEDGFSSGFYQKILESPKQLEIYIKATQKMIKRVKENPHLTLPIKAKISQALLTMFKNEMVTHMRKFMQLRKIRGAYCSAKIFHRYYGRSLYLWLLLFPIAAHIYLPFFRPFVRVSAKLVNIRRNRKIRLEAPSNRYAEYADLIQEYIRIV